MDPFLLASKELLTLLHTQRWPCQLLVFLTRWERGILSLVHGGLKLVHVSTGLWPFLSETTFAANTSGTPSRDQEYLLGRIRLGMTRNAKSG